MLPFLKSMVSSKLLRPAFIALVIVAVLQAVLIISITRTNVSGLRDNVESGLNSSEQEITSQLTSANAQVDSLIIKMASKAGTSLSTELTTNLEREERTIEEGYRRSLQQSARTLATIMAQISPPAIWDNDIPELTRLVEMVHQTDNIVFAIFISKENKPLTRYLNRTDPLIKTLLASSNLRGSVNRVIDAASRNSSLLVIREPIKSRDVEIGEFILGVSNIELNAEVQSLKDRFSQLVTQSDQSVTQIIKDESANVVDTLQRSLKGITNNLAETVASSINTIDAGSSALSGRLTTVVMLTSILLLISMALLLTKQILSKVNILRSALWDIAEGEGDLTQRATIKGRDEIADMAKALNRFIEKTQGIISDVNHSADHATGMTGTLSNNAHSANDAVNKQRLEVESISSAIAQMSSSIQHVAERIQTAVHNVDKIKTESGEASAVSTRVREQLNQLVQEITNASQVVTELESYSDQIGSVLDVIRGIAEQTNLLALNAAIEAARAGESGRGFAVVADEVRALASKTQESTTEIQKNIESLQLGSTSAVKAIHSASQVAQTSIATFSTSDTHLDGVATSVKQLFDLSTDIAAMAEEQTHVAEEINRNIANISDAAEETAASVNQATKSSIKIDDVVKELRHKVSRFKV